MGTLWPKVQVSSSNCARTVGRKMRSGTVTTKRGALKRLRIARGLTQWQLAEMAGCAKRTIENAESGKPMYLATVVRLACVLNVAVDELLEGTRKRSTKETQLQPNPSTNHVFRIYGGAPPLGHRLIGRDSDLAAIRETLQSVSEAEAGVVVIRGVAGVGKSSLLNTLARDTSLADRFPGGGLWAAAGATPDLTVLLRIWGHALRVAPGRLLRVDEAAAAVREKLQHRKMLVLVDDVWSVAHAQALRVGGPGSVTLYTTRLLELAVRLAPSPDAIYRLDGLTQPGAMELLSSHAPRVVRERRRLCEQLIDSVEGLPLALAVAGKMLHREWQSGGDVEELLRRVRDDARGLLSQPVPPDMVDLLDQTTPSVAAVLRRSTVHLPADLKHYFARLGSFAPAPATFPLFFVAGHWSLDEQETRKIIRSFVDLGLLEVNRRGQYSIHPLIKALALHEWEIADESGAK